MPTSGCAVMSILSAQVCLDNNFPNWDEFILDTAPYAIASNQQKWREKIVKCAEVYRQYFYSSENSSEARIGFTQAVRYGITNLIPNQRHLQKCFVDPCDSCSPDYCNLCIKVKDEFSKPIL